MTLTWTIDEARGTIRFARPVPRTGNTYALAVEGGREGASYAFSVVDDDARELLARSEEAEGGALSIAFTSEALRAAFRGRWHELRTFHVVACDGANVVAEGDLAVECVPVWGDGTGRVFSLRGPRGVGIAGIEPAGLDEAGNALYRLYLTDGSALAFAAPRGPAGETGGAHAPDAAGAPHALVALANAAGELLPAVEGGARPASEAYADAAGENARRAAEANALRAAEAKVASLAAEADAKLGGKADRADLADRAAKADLDAHAADRANPHGTTAGQVGAYTKAEADARTAAAVASKADLGSDGKVPASQLPSYVDDVLEYAAASAFPQAGETGKIYVAKDTNLAYRWGGTAYVEISPSVALGETASTAYPGDRGRAAAEKAAEAYSAAESLTNAVNSLAGTIGTHARSTGNPHKVTASQVGALPLTGGTLTGELAVGKEAGAGRVKVIGANGNAGVQLDGCLDDASLRGGVVRATGHPYGGGGCVEAENGAYGGGEFVARGGDYGGASLDLVGRTNCGDAVLKSGDFNAAPTLVLTDNTTSDDNPVLAEVKIGDVDVRARLAELVAAKASAEANARTHPVFVEVYMGIGMEESSAVQAGFVTVYPEYNTSRVVDIKMFNETTQSWTPAFSFRCESAPCLLGPFYLTDAEYNGPVYVRGGTPSWAELNGYVTVKCGACLEAETPITMADGSARRVADIREGDEVLSIDPATGETTTDTVTAAARGFRDGRDVWFFDDGSTVTTVGRHRFYDVDLGEFLYLEAWNGGERARRRDGRAVRLVSHARVAGRAEYATLWTARFNNYFAGGLLAGNRRSVAGKGLWHE